MTAPDLAARIGGLRDWLLQAAWPYWLRHGIDHDRAGFHEAVPCHADFRRLRVVARQIYVFSEAHRAGVAGAAEAVALGLSFLRRHAAHREGGYAWRFGLDNRVTNPVRDLYDQAFVLLALASATAVAAAPPLRRAALELVAWMDRAMTHEAGGYREAEPPLAGAPRRQNPHMHLLEAMLAAHEAFGDPVFLHHASALVGLFLDRMFDAVTGTLPEFFDEAWHPVPHPGGYLIEPGHHCEWVWLLDWHARLTGPNQATEAASAALMRFVDRFGHAPAGGMADIVTSQGDIVEGATRLWGQAERLKAELIRKDGTAARQLAAAGILAGFLHEDGGFHDRKDAAGRMIAAPAPASSLYHLTSAILTAERCVLTHATHDRTSGA